ncbi:hypothetical protein F3P66_18775 [Agrobacterium fabrum]|uniref:Secreted protein n=1 Tax=Agrobacterium fabrum (strain C58 / ATCC 33970) TaxID=176299 RepID=Q8U987_AGRFC|nr:hypothetical protein Atu3841 [Agrobacterium fabrum str. C58]QRM61470.1 hypothetical protein F3P66_18775 [Agrobacterium fabrum]TRB27357.1 hypothetical protein EXN51_19590 [Agrobacterium fabrum]
MPVLSVKSRALVRCFCSSATTTLFADAKSFERVPSSGRQILRLWILVTKIFYFSYLDRFSVKKTGKPHHRANIALWKSSSVGSPALPWRACSSVRSHALRPAICPAFIASSNCCDARFGERSPVARALRCHGLETATDLERPRACITVNKLRTTYTVP